MGSKFLYTTVFKGKDETKGAFGSMSKGAEKLSGLISGLAPALTAGAFLLAGKQALDSADNIQKLNQRIGASTEALSQYRHVAKLSGVEFKSLTTGWQRMTRRISDAATVGKGEAVPALEALGLSAKALAALKPEDQFEAIADAMQGVGNQGEKTSIAMKLFDTEGVALLQTMENGSEGIRAMREEADLLGMTLGIDQVNAAAAANDAIARMKSSFEGIIQTLAIQFAPTLEGIAKFMSTAIPDSIGLVGAAIGTAQSAITDFISSVAEGLASFYDVLAKLPGDLGKTYEDAAKTVRQFSATMSDMSVDYAIAAVDAVEKAEKFKFKLGDVANVAKTQAAPQMKNLAAKVGEYTKSTVKATKAEKDAEKAKKKLHDQQARLTKTFDDAVNTLENEIKALTLVGAELEAFTIQQEVANLVGEEFNELSQDQIDILTNLTEKYNRLTKEKEDTAAADKLATDSAVNYANTVGDAFTQLFGSALNGFEDFSSTMSGMMDGLLNGLLDQLGSAAGSGGFGDMFGSLFGGGADAAGAAAGGGGGGIASFLSSPEGGAGLGAGVGTLFGNESAQLGGTIGGAIGSIWGPIGSSIGSLLGSLVGNLFNDENDPRIDVVNNGVAPGSQYWDPTFGRESAFGFSIQGQRITEELGRDGAGEILDAIQQFDATMAAILNPEEVQRVFDRLYNTSNLYEGDISAEEIINDRLGSIIQVLEPRVRALVEPFNDMASRVDAIVAAKEMFAAIDSDAITMYQEAVDRQSDSFVESVQRQADAVLDLANNFDGSIDAMRELTAGTTNFNAAVANILLTIDAAQNAIGVTTGNTIDNLTFQTLDQDGQFDFLTRRAEDLAASIDQMSDPQRIAETVAQINAMVSQAFGLADETQQQDLLGSFSDFLQTTADSADSRLEDVREQIQEAYTEANEEMREVMNAAATEFTAAAQTIFDGGVEIGNGGRQIVGGADRFNSGVNRWLNAPPIQVIVDYRDVGGGF